MDVDRWSEQFEVKLAAALADDDSAGAFFDTLSAIAEAGIVKKLDAACREHGLTFGEVVDLQHDVSDAEWEADPNNSAAIVASETARQAVRRLFLAGYDPKQVAHLLNLYTPKVEAYLEQFPRHPQAHEVIRRHLDGVQYRTIAHELGMARSTVASIITSFGGEPPHRAYRVLTAGEKFEILRRTKAGETQGEIGKSMGLPIHSVKNTLRAYRNSMVPDVEGRDVA